jgi:uncharacterized glyoxalase superfamily protein PhnB
VKIEHTAYQVADPVALAEWYVSHLGLRIKRAQNAAPFGVFLADDGDAVMLEFYRNPKVPVPDYLAMNPLTLHLAFRVDGDMRRERDRLVSAGATLVTDVQSNEVGDTVAMLRDPWGLALQLVQRQDPMI